MTSILTALRNIVIPNTSKRAYRIAIALIVAAGTLEAIFQPATSETPLFKMTVNLMAVGFVVALWYFVLGWFRSRQEHVKDLEGALSIAHDPTANDYTSIEYGSLGYSLRHMPAYIPLVAGITVLVLLGLVWIMILFGDPDAGRTSGTLLPGASSILAAFAIAGVILVTIGARMVKRDNILKPSDEKYRLFVADNNFTHQVAARGESLDYDLDSIQLGKVPKDQRVAMNITTGVYRGRKFELLGLCAKKRRDWLYFGLVRRPSSATYQPKLRDNIQQLDESGEVLDVVFDRGNINIVMSHHPPRDLVGMVRIFRYLDAIDASGYDESLNLGANNGQ